MLDAEVHGQRNAGEVEAPLVAAAIESIKLAKLVHPHKGRFAVCCVVISSLLLLMGGAATSTEGILILHCSYAGSETISIHGGDKTTRNWSTETTFKVDMVHGRATDESGEAFRVAISDQEIKLTNKVGNWHHSGYSIDRYSGVLKFSSATNIEGDPGFDYSLGSGSCKVVTKKLIE
jgi:hypothetical protein